MLHCVAVTGEHSASPVPFAAVTRPFRRLVRAVAFALIAAAIAACQAGPADAQTVGGFTGTRVRQITVTRNKSRTFELERPFVSAVVGSPDIADVLPMSDRVLYVQGKKPGTTNITIFGRDKHVLSIIDVEVTLDANSIAGKIRANVRSPGIRVSATHEQLVLTGEAMNASDAEAAVQIAKAMVPDGTPLINLIKVTSPQQVLLKVRFLEVSRQAERDLGVNWFGSNNKQTAGFNSGLGAPSQIGQSPTTTPGGLPIFSTAGALAGTSGASPFAVGLANLSNSSMNLDMLVSALETKGLTRSLAEPDLIALSGDTASFIAGGEVPIPVVQPSSGATPTITVDYKPFGVQLTFVPTVLANGIINLRLTPSVSELDYTNAVYSQGYKIPALTKREARTTIELRDGQSFAIAGLLQSEGLRNISEVPWVGTVPVLGTLFRSSSYQNNETDLVVIVTVHLVAPASPGQRLTTPFDSHLPSNDVDFFVVGQTDVPKKYTEFVTAGGGVAGPYGHIVPLDGK